MKCYTILFLVFLVLSGAHDTAQAQSVSYLGIENGLSNNTVTAIHKDKFGLMWFGTLDGINRYDGYSFKVFRNKYNDSTSLPNDIITAINSDDLGNIWVGTQKGVGVYENKTLQFAKVNYVSNGTQLPVTNWINTIQKDSRGNIYIGANDVGLLLCQSGSKEAIRIPIFRVAKKRSEHYSVTAMSSPREGRMWVAIDGLGLAFYDLGSRQLILTNNNVSSATCITSDILGNLWIGTKHGLFHYDVKTKIAGRFDLGGPVFNIAHISSLMFDKSRRLWIAIDGQGMLEIDGIANNMPRVLSPFRDALSSDALFTIIEDDQSRKWIGTLRGGIQVIDERKNQFKTYRHSTGDANSLVNNFTFSFCQDRNDNVWIGTDGGGLSIWDRKQNNFKNFVYSVGKNNVLSDNRISSIVRDTKDNMWMGSYGAGVVKYNFDRKAFQKVNFQNPAMEHSIWRLYIDKNEDVWVLCLRGDWTRKDSRLFKFNKQTNSFFSAPFDVGEDVLAITDDDKNNFWMGGVAGIMHANKVRGIDKTINLKTIVRALHKSSKGILWIGTYGRGLIAFDTKSNRFTSYTEENGLCNNKVLNIEEDNKGNIWVSTCNGISKVTPSTGKISNFYAADGLQSNQFYFNASAHLRSGELIFGGIKGFNIFNPDSIRQFHDFPPLIISGIRIANSVVNAESEFLPNAKNVYTVNKITLPYDKAILSLDYVALEYSLPEKIQYAYFLKGRDKSWNYVNNLRSINYSRLNEGEYVLKIKSTNASGIWNTKEKVIYVTVIPPWYRTWWAYLLYIGLTGGSIYGYLFYHKKQTRLQYEVKLANIKTIQEKELNEKKISFFTNISHELRTPLTLIANPIKELLNNNGKDVDLIDLSSVYRNSRRLLSLVDQLLLFKTAEDEISELKAEWLNLTDVCREVFLCFNNQVQAKSLQYHFECNNDHIKVYADREKIEIVLFNLLSNAIKFTPEQGSISLILAEQNENVEILVKDSGRGIPEETGARLFEKFYRLTDADDKVFQSGFGIGLFLTKKYIDIHRGNITYTSKLNEGTVFRIMMPKGDSGVAMPLYKDDKKEHINSHLLKELVIEPIEKSASDFNSETDNLLLSNVITQKASMLLIDDDLELRHYIKQLLKDTFIIYEADNADTGFEIVMKSEPDIIVCDVVMQGMSGVEFCSKLKELPAFSHIPVILLTGSSSPEIKLKGIECGAEDYITKPFENDLLVARIKGILKGRNSLKRYFFNEITLQNNSLKIPEEYSAFLSRCIAIIEEHMTDEGFSLGVFTQEICMSRWTLSKKVKSISGLSISEFIRYIRLRKAAELMIQTDLQIKEVAFRVGIPDVKYFRKGFCKLFEMTPSDFIRKYRKTYIKNHNLNSGFGSSTK